MTKRQHYKINVNVETHYLQEQSEESNHVFSYTMTITNTGSLPTKLLTRHWIITNAFDECTEVEGDGVAGKQPLIQPGESYQYTSGAILDTPVGTMQGSYQLLAEDGQFFEAEIAPFTLASPHSLH